MKKFLPFLIIAFMGLFVISCDNRDEIVNQEDFDTYSKVIDYKNVSFLNTANGFQLARNLPFTLYDSDVMLVYRQTGTLTNGSPIWQSIPNTLYLPQGALDYDFDFSKVDFTIYADGSYDISTTPSYLNAQNFRVVLVPASFKTTVDLNDYDAVIKAYGIDDSKPTKL